MAALRPSDLAGQLISPGKLTSAHAELEGFRNCTQCHQRGQRGVANDLCTACHVPLGRRIERGAGLHAEFAEQECGTCHKEHVGRDADIVRFSTEGFEHDDVGFDLVEAHGSLSCGACHNRSLIRDPAVRRFKAAGGALDNTFLGLGDTCLSCHTTDDPHLGQFDGETCDDCHTQTAWEGADRFDHGRARFQLSGMHVRVECAACHAPASGPGGTLAQRFRPLSFGTCVSCHADNHEGAMGRDCSECHTTAGWGEIPRSAFEEGFNHSRTSYELVGAHATLACASCHRPSEDSRERIRIAFAAHSSTTSYPTPLVENACLSCHVDRHEREFAATTDYGNCVSCHSEHAWLPSTFDLFRHETTEFPLQGAHLAVECSSCHGAPAGTATWDFDLGQPTCAQCHEVDDPHAGQFAGRACRDCHSDESFEIASFDHAAAGYDLEGAHADVPCAGCHASEQQAGELVVRYRPVPRDCNACHTQDSEPLR